MRRKEEEKLEKICKNDRSQNYDLTVVAEMAQSLYKLYPVRFTSADTINRNAAPV